MPYAIRHRLKIQIRVNGTPADKVILVQPNAVVQDLFDEQMKCVCMIENHHASTEAGYWRTVPISGILHCELDDEFIPSDWKPHTDLGTNDVIESV